MSNKLEHTSAFGINYEPNKKLGYYTVGNDLYYNKFQAYLDAAKQNKFAKWFFNDEVFIRYPWHIEPEESLEELYRRRAQDLRDRYDYIRIDASGGADSSTVVYSFLLNKIHVDEVVFRYPKQGEQGVSGNPHDTRAENTLSEWEFAAKPLLEWIAVHSPETKITVHDYSEDMIKDADERDESWIFRTRHYLQPGHIYKHDVIALDDHKRQADRNMTIGVIHGIDKPKICIKDNKFFLYFVDSTTNHNSNVVDDYTNITNEFFYWSPDACDLLAKQAHTLKHWFSMPMNHKFQGVLHWPNNDFATRTVYENIIKSIIYPHYDSSTFQTMKPTNNIWNEMDHWFHTNFVGSKSYQTWQAGIDYLVKTLGPDYVEYLDGRPANIKGFASTLYYIDDCHIPEVTAVQTRAKLQASRQNITVHNHLIKGKLVLY